MKNLLFTLLIALSLNSVAQHIFPVKVGSCNTERFCLDCGDIEAGYDKEGFLDLQNKVNNSLNLRNVKGAVKFQVLVDSAGTGCVLSHTDRSSSDITLKIIKELNKFKKWTPAITNNKKEIRSSIIVVFTLGDNRVFASIERIDRKALMKSFDRPLDPVNYNTHYIYENTNLDKYKMTIWNSSNSDLPNNMSTYITIDKDELIWLAVDGSLVTFDGSHFKIAEQNITDKGRYFGYNALATDNNNVKWVFAKDNIYSCDNMKWKKYDSSEVGINRALKIINNPTTGEVFFCSGKGLTLFKNGNWSLINTTSNNELPSNRVGFAKRDSKNRLWIGTFTGTAMIDENGKTTNFEFTETVLKGKCIMGMAEDEKGNIYFSLYQFGPKEKGKLNNDEGIAVLYADNTYKQLTTDNSGLPVNSTNQLLYDKNEKILWISTDRAGLIRFDLDKGWENYHNQNSEIPTSFIAAMEFDKHGNLILATRQGLVKIEKK